MLTNAHVGEGGVKKGQKCAHVINERPLRGDQINEFAAMTETELRLNLQ